MSYLTIYERYQIETMLKDHMNRKEIAKRLNRHYNTICNEIKKGTVELLNSDYTTRLEYCADYAQLLTDTRSHNKGIEYMYDLDKDLHVQLLHLIRDLHYSPYAAIQQIKKEGKLKYCMCEVTLYKYIHENLISGLSDDDLYIKRNKKYKKPIEPKKRPAYHKLGAKSIEERPQEVNFKKTVGHWEMDTVYSGKNHGKAALLVLTERCTTDQLTFLLPDRTAKSVKNCLDRLERSLGARAFRNKFKTITCDNGVEFVSQQIEKSAINKKLPRTSVYFCHPYCSCERGMNESQNRFYRRFVSSGGNLADLTADQWQEVNDWVNNYPRRKYGGMSVNEYKKSIGIA